MSSISLGNYGDDIWWCSSSHAHVSYVLLFSTVGIISTTIFCYLSVMYRIRTINGTLSKERSENNNENCRRLTEINYRFGIKAITYIFIFMLQW